MKNNTDELATLQGDEWVTVLLLGVLHTWAQTTVAYCLPVY